MRRKEAISTLRSIRAGFLCNSSDIMTKRIIVQATGALLIEEYPLVYMEYLGDLQAGRISNIDIANEVLNLLKIE